MRKTFLLLFSIAFMACGSIYLAACHSSGGGNAGTAVSATGTDASTFSRGVVVGTGSSMSVNGVEFNTNSANVLIDGDSGSPNDVKMGQVVTIRGTSSGKTGTASDVFFNNDLTGPISGVTTSFSSGVISSATMTVFGQTITVDANTITEPADLDISSLQTGSVVEVSGLPDAAGNILATFIESKPTASTFNIRGLVSNSTGSAFTLTPDTNGKPLQVTFGTTATRPANLQNGNFVNVKIDPATVTNQQAGSLQARSVTIENPNMPAEGDVVFVEGFTTNSSGSTFTVSGIPVNAGTQTVPAAGSRVVVHGTFTGGVLSADLIMPAGAVNLTIGEITSANATTGGTGAGGTGIGTGGAGTLPVQEVACPASGTTDVTITDFVFTPANVTVPANTIVRWTNNGPSLHTVTNTAGATNGTFDSGTLNAGSSVCFSFTAPSTYNYFCTIHPFMTGSVTVQGGAGAGFGSGTGIGTLGTGTSFGGGTGGTGTGTGGTISNGTGTNATIVVNGTAFDVSSAKIRMNGLPASLADLRPGKMVIVKSPIDIFSAGIGTGGTGTGGFGIGTGGTGTGGTGIGTGGTGAGGTGTGTGGAGTGSSGAGGAGGDPRAIAVWIIDNIQGPLAQNATVLVSGTTGTTGGLVSTGTFTIFNQTIVMSDITRFEPSILGSGSLSSFTTGTVVDVSGMPDGVGDLFATLIQSRPTATEYHVRGLVSAVTGSPATSFTLTPVPEGTPLRISLASGVTTSAGFAEGATVNVRINPATFTTGATTITAKAVDLVKEPAVLENTVMSLEGIVSNISGNTFTVNGMKVNAGSLPITGLQNGKSRVRIEGTVSGGTLMATKVQTL
jgi:plastocyanin